MFENSKTNIEENIVPGKKEGTSATGLKQTLLTILDDARDGIADAEFGVLGSVTPAMDLNILNKLPDGVYEAQIAGVYKNGLTAKEGYYTRFRKTANVWQLESETKIPMQDLTKIESDIEKSIKKYDIIDSPYNINSIVFYEDKLYKSLKNNNTDLPTNIISWKVISEEIVFDVPEGASSYELVTGEKTFSQFAWGKISPPLTSSYYSYNSITQEIKENQYADFRTATFSVEQGSVIKVKIGMFYVQNNANKINPLLIHIKDSEGNIVYLSNGSLESGVPVTSVGQDGATGVFEFEKNIDVDGVVYVSCDFKSGGEIFDIFVKEKYGQDFKVLNTSMANKPGGYKTFDGIDANKYKGKKIAILGDSLSEDPPSGQAPTTSKYWYSYMKESLGVDYKTYAVSGNTWKDVYNQAVSAKASGINYDMFIIFAGTNDFYFNVPIGEFYTTTGNTRTLNLSDATFKGRINKVLNYLKRNFVNSQIVVLNILHRGAAHGTPSELTANSSGVFLDEYSKAVDEGASRWSVPIIDVRGESGLYPVVPEALAYFTSENDYLHLSAIGHEKLWKYMQNKLLNLPI